ncbi:MAG: hypothetical protein HZC54_19815 [Verrucomicrobia bacterium]|nr:hypothetical protein [Verrucomicrobiota bacterium]
MSFNPSLPADNSPLSSSEMRGQLTSLHDETASVLDDVTTGTIPKKTGDGTLGDSAISEDDAKVIVAGGKLFSLRRSDSPDTVLLEVHSGTEAVLHIRISADGSRIAFNSNRSGFSFQSPLDVNGAPLAMKPVSVGPFGGTISDPPTQSEVQAIVAWVETLREAL